MLLVALLHWAQSCAHPVAPCCGDPPPSQEAPAGAAVTQEQRAKLKWFEGTFEELLAEASRSQRLVFLEFWSQWIPLSKKIDKLTLSDPKVVAELEGVLCYSVDADCKQGKALRKKFQVQTPPVLVFLDPEGSLREQLSGFFAPESLLVELARIKRNEGTFSDLRARIQADPADLDARWVLACKHRYIGDLPGFEEQVSQIRERDPEGKMVASRRLRLYELHSAAAAQLDLEPLYAFVRDEKDRKLLFEGWLDIWNLEGQAARSTRDVEKSRAHELRYFAAARALWPLVPKEEHGRLGNNIAWNFYLSRANATRSDLEFALAVAEKAVAAAPDHPAVVDTYACCLFAVGRRDESLLHVKRCIDLDPQNPQWRERLAEFQKSR